MMSLFASIIGLARVSYLVLGTVFVDFVNYFPFITAIWSFGFVTMAFKTDWTRTQIEMFGEYESVSCRIVTYAIFC